MALHKADVSEVVSGKKGASFAGLHKKGINKNKAAWQKHSATEQGVGRMTGRPLPSLMELYTKAATIITDTHTLHTVCCLLVQDLKIVQQFLPQGV